jgi:hypothetical protein
MSYVDRRRALDTRGRRRVSARGRNWGGGNGRHFLDAAGKTGSGRGSGIASTCSNSRGGTGVQGEGGVQPTVGPGHGGVRSDCVWHGTQDRGMGD